MLLKKKVIFTTIALVGVGNAANQLKRVESVNLNQLGNKPIVSLGQETGKENCGPGSGSSRGQGSGQGGLWQGEIDTTPGDRYFTQDIPYTEYEVKKRPITYEEYTVEEIPKVEEIVEEIPIEDFEFSMKPVVPLSDGDSSTQQLEYNSEGYVESCGMQFNKCYALYSYERPEFFLSATQDIDNINPETPDQRGFSIISLENGLENADAETYTQSIWKIVAGLDDELGSISLKGVGYDEPYYLKTINGDHIRMKALSTSAGRMVFKQKASWKCLPSEEGFIYLENNNIDVSSLGEPEYLGVDITGTDDEMVGVDDLNPSDGWVPKEMQC